VSAVHRRDPVRPRGRRVTPACPAPGARGRRRGRGDAGNTAIELVLFMPLLFFAIFATVQFGLTYLGNSAASSAAREAARIARTGGDCAAAEARGQEILSTIGRGLIEGSGQIDAACGAEEVTVTVNAQGVSIVPGLPATNISQVVRGPVESFRADTP